MINYRNFNNGIAEKSERLMTAIAERAAFYRANPQRLAEDYLGIKLKLFQQILIMMMFSNNYIMSLGARGISKTYTIAVFCVIRCILYPGTTINIASKTLKQASEVLKKIETELMPRSANLRLEISKCVSTGSDPIIKFKNGSNIIVPVASDTGRGGRCQVLVCDEFRLMDKNIIDMVLKNRMRVERHPGYLDKKEYEDYGSERNQLIMLTSAWYKSHWAYKEAQSYTVDLFNQNKKTFICGLPYQLAIKENLLNREQVEDEMASVTFNSMQFSMESECLWWGEAENAFFKFDSLEKSRRLNAALYPQEIYSHFPNKLIKPIEKQSGEIRLLSIDIAVMSSRKNKNDASSIFVVQLIPTKDGQYVRNVLYTETYEGGHSRDQAMVVRRLFEQMNCDYIVIDAQGVGMGVFDNLVDDMTDDITGQFYPAFNCLNDDTMAEHYKGSSRSPQRVIYSIKANAKWNSQCAYSLRDCIERGKMRLLISEEEFEERMEKDKTYQELSLEDQLDLKMPYIQTSLLINELVNLEYMTIGTEIKVKETSGNRKDRYSSLSYANQIANELERKLQKPSLINQKVDFSIRAPSCMKVLGR